MSKLFDVLLKVNDGKITDESTINDLGHIILKSNNKLYIQNYLFSVVWSNIDEELLINLIVVVLKDADIKLTNKIIKKLYEIKKYDLIQKIYIKIEKNEILNEVIVNNARNFIVKNYFKENIYDELLEAKIFLGLLCDKSASKDNIDRSFELVKHIESKKNYKKA